MALAIKLVTHAVQQDTVERDQRLWIYLTARVRRWIEPLHSMCILTDIGSIHGEEEKVPNLSCSLRNAEREGIFS